ncbi:hypothetical protein Ancab_021290 [Ancistrocladus abbreviatus]
MLKNLDGRSVDELMRSSMIYEETTKVGEYDNNNKTKGLALKVESEGDVAEEINPNDASMRT